jgi:hypothetical protein
MEAVDPRVPLALLPDNCQADVINGPRGDEYKDLPAVCTPEGAMITRWTFTAAERARIAAGEDLYLTVWTVKLGDQRIVMPMFATVGVVNWRAAAETP